MSKHSQKYLIVACLAALLLVQVVYAQTVSAPPSESGTADLVLASAEYEDVQFDDNVPIEQLLESAREMFIADNYHLSEMLYKGVLVRDPNNLSAMLELAIIYEATHKLEYARGLLSRASILKPDDLEVTKRLNSVAVRLATRVEAEVDSLLAIGAYDAALPKLSILLTTQPENPELYYQKAVCHLELGRHRASVAEVDKAIKLKKDQRYFTLRDQAASWMETRERKRLRRDAEALLLKDSEASQAQALEYVSRILQIDPDDAWAKQQFVALTEVDDAESGAAFGSRFGGLLAKIQSFAKPLGGAAVDVLKVLNDHIEILLYVLLALLVLFSPFTHMVIRGFSPRQSLTGQLSQFSIHEVLTMVNTHHRTGVLSIKTGSARGQVFFSSGEIYHCKTKNKKGRDALQQLLANAKDGFFVFKDKARTSDRTIDTPLSLILMELPERKGAITSQTILKKQQTKMKRMLETSS